MNPRKDSGFTIIEVTLVFAISSLLLLLMMTGITLAVQRQRFSDSVNGTQSFLQQQFNLTQNTINDRSESSCDPSNPGDLLPADASGRGASDCLIIGKLIEIDQTTEEDESMISSYDVVAENVDTEADAYRELSDIDLIRAVKPTAIKRSAPDANYIVPWGAEVRDVKDSNDTGSISSTIRFVALLRSPRSGIIHTYKIANDLTEFTSSADNNRQLSSANIQEIANGSVKMCMTSIDLANFGGMLEIKPTGSQDGEVAHFDEAAKEAYACS